ncbi:CotO family spore coat protein [Ornithinibacillus scapharcae]|uniref:CotO family spore coat protein n=1 Tax=Ornithinibacillus scapharcae TaxID=1147159 RepID=UPI000225B293|nr:CotO family spore coat protein [Ornithinibacillus scapharcae]
MAKNRKFAREPLLYIHQPTVSSPNAPMQHSYVNQRKQTSTAPETEKKTPPKAIKKRPSTELIAQSITKELKEPLPKQPKKRRPVLPVQEVEGNNESIESKAIDTTKLTEETTEDKATERKKFKDMSTTEKIEYFINTPQHLPRMRSEVRTDEKKYRGVIINMEEDEIIMRVGRRSTRIKIDDITDIQLLGF